MGSRKKIITPPTEEQLKSWLIEYYGDNFEPSKLQSIIKQYLGSVNEHTMYSKKKSISYISKNIFVFDRLYRKQEKQYWILRGWNDIEAENKRIVRNQNWYIDTYGEVEGLERYKLKCENISKNSGHSLEKFIQRYGETDGERRYIEYKKHTSKASKESLLVFNKVLKHFENIIYKSDIYYGVKNSREYFISTSDAYYLFDFTIRSLKLIIEFNGVKFHINPEWSDEVKQKWKHPFDKNKTYEEILEYDIQKYKVAKDQGFDLLVIWSDTPIEENVEKCINFINKKLC